MWTGVTSPADTEFGPASEAEYLDGKIYVWRGLLNGGAVNGSDSFLYVYDIAANSWSATPTLQSFGVVPGLRSGAIDIWGVSITSDDARKLLFANGGEANRQIYVFDITAQVWSTAPVAIYDGGWGDGLEYVTGPDTLYQIDGRNTLNTPQGTAAMRRSCGDFDGDGDVDAADLAELLASWGPCVEPCCPTDFDGDGDVDAADLAELLSNWGPC